MMLTGGNVNGTNRAAGGTSADLKNTGQKVSQLNPVAHVGWLVG